MHFTNYGTQEPFCTIPHAAKRLGIPTSTLRRAVNTGLVPHYRPLSNRIRVRLSEVEAAILMQEEG